MVARVRLSIRFLVPLPFVLHAAVVVADPGPPPPGYLLQRVSDAVPATALANVSQLAFRPGDGAHLYAARTYSDVITRYDFDEATGLLSNPLDVTATLPLPHGLAFRGTDLYVSLNVIDDSRIARLRDLDQDGVFEDRADFVRGVPTLDHKINQLQIFGSALFAGIGLRKNSGRPECENAYTGTIARIADLDQIDYAGGANYLPSPAEFVNAAPVDGMLRRYAYGLRNPFGLRVDALGNVWASDNGASFCNTCSSCANFAIDTPDLFYRQIPPGAKGEFPPVGFPGGGGATMTRFATLATHAAVTGFAWIATGPDAGHILLAEYGSTDTVLNAGRDIVRIDPTTGVASSFITGFAGPTDIIPDAHGRLLIADNAANAIYLLTAPGVVGVTLGPAHESGAKPRIERIAPNPSDGAITVEYWIGSSSPVSLRIVDITGREVAAMTDGLRPSGRHRVRLSPDAGLAGLASGVYLCCLETRLVTVVERFVHTR